MLQISRTTSDRRPPGGPWLSLAPNTSRTQTMCTPSIGRPGGPCHLVGTPQMLRIGGPTLRARRDDVVARASSGQQPYGPEYLYQVIEVISSGPDLETI